MSRSTAARRAPDAAVRNAVPAAMRAFFRIAEAWGLANAESRALLGNPPESTFYRWKSGAVSGVGQDTVERISYVLGIYKSLQVLLPEPRAADAWVRAPNDAPLFGGRPALERMLSGRVADLYVVREYLDAERGA